MIFIPGLQMNGWRMQYRQTALLWTAFDILQGNSIWQSVSLCYPENVPDCNGRSTVFDGVAYLPDEEGSRDTCILEADGSEGIYIAELDLKQLRDYRKSEVHGNAYRHPQKYGILIDTKVEEPFIREDYRR